MSPCLLCPGFAVGDPAEGGGPSHGLAVAAGQPESDAELPQPGGERERPDLPGGEGAHHEPHGRPPRLQLLQPRPPTPPAGWCALKVRVECVEFEGHSDL